MSRQSAQDGRRAAARPHAHALRHTHRKRVARPRHEVSRASLVIDAITDALGRPTAVALAAATVVVWLAFGPLVGFSDTYQLIINTGTTIVTFVMVFAIQHTTNRETKAINLKLDALLDAVHGASSTLVGVERSSDATIERLRKREADRAAR